VSWTFEATGGAIREIVEINCGDILALALREESLG
jgi:hypothetical protein